ncbi:MAG: hypothetical protein UDG86_16605 [Lachnospiraceae bacterium]|nr:hypothetical protein [Lachnospiraceae bacterium]
MARKQGIKDKIGQAVMIKPGMNKKMLVIKRSLDEVNGILNNDKKKSK